MKKKKTPPSKKPAARKTSGPPRGTIIIIGGHEDKEGDRTILKELARRAGQKKLVVCTFASEEPDAQWEQYKRCFRKLGVRKVVHLDVREREDLDDDPRADIFDGAAVLFFAGGDQLKITAKLGGTPLCAAMREMYRRGGTIAGTSSGASVMGDTMLIAGESSASPTRDNTGHMAPGLGLLTDVIIDQHFAERGRIGRLMGAVALNPRLLGLGLDEDTAVIFGRNSFTVVGNGSVYVVDGTDVKHTGFAHGAETENISIYNMRVHILAEADKFNLDKRKPTAVPRDKIEQELKKRRK